MSTRDDPRVKYKIFLEAIDKLTQVKDIAQNAIGEVLPRKDLPEDIKEILYVAYVQFSISDLAVERAERRRDYLKRYWNKLEGNKMRQREKRGTQGEISAMSDEELSQIQSDMEAITDEELERIAKEQGW